MFGGVGFCNVGGVAEVEVMGGCIEEGFAGMTTTRRTASCCAKWPSTSTMPAGRRPALEIRARWAPWSM